MKRDQNLHLRLTRAFVACAVLASAACGTPVDGGLDMAPSTDFGGTLDENGSPTRELSGKVTGKGLPLADVKVCVSPAMGACTMTTSDGKYTLAGVPIVGNTAVVFVHAGYRSDLVPITQNVISVGIAMFPDDLFDAWGTTISTATLAGNGTIAINAAVSGATLTIDPSGAAGPFYLSSTNPDATVTEKLSGSVSLFVNVTPGTYAVTIEPGAGKTCAISWGWPSSLPNTALVTVTAGVVSSVSLSCQ